MPTRHCLRTSSPWTPTDKFDLYTIYAGVTSNVTTGIYLDLPARYTDNSLIIKAIDGSWRPGPEDPDSDDE